MQDSVKFSLDLTRNVGTYECYLFRERFFSKYPHHSVDVAREYVRLFEQGGNQAANLALLQFDALLTRGTLNLTKSPDELKEFAITKARTCDRIIVHTHPAELALKKCDELAEEIDLPIPARTKNQTNILPILNRYKDEQWWLRKIHTLRNRSIDQLNRLILQVHKGESSYCSEETQGRHLIKKKAQRKYLESTTLVNSAGQSFRLADVHDSSVSNPAIRRAEFMTRIKGFELVSQTLGHISEFYTLTTPSKFHPVRGNGKPNEKFNHSTPKDANNHLTHTYQLIRNELRRRGVQIYGVRVVEPHHDGTPHWHLLLFMEPEHKKIVRRIFRHYALLEDGDEAGAKKYRFKPIAIDPAKGSATGYVAKYISKNIDGAHLADDLHGNDAAQASVSINAWASTWGIRQFQFTGGPSVTVWRELRKIREQLEPDLECLRNPADAGDWAAFVLAMGGPTLPRNCRPLKPAYQLQTEEGDAIDRETGELLPTKATRYGDVPKGKLEGLLKGARFLKTRTHDWQILSSSNVESFVQGARAGARSRSDLNEIRQRAPEVRALAPKALSDLCQ